MGEIQLWDRQVSDYASLRKVKIRKKGISVLIWEVEIKKFKSIQRKNEFTHMDVAKGKIMHSLVEMNFEKQEIEKQENLFTEQMKQLVSAG